MSKTVLVVDDSVSMRQMVAFTLKQKQLAVVEGGNGKEALERLKSHKVDLIITDLNMPEMDGITFIRHVRASAGPHKFVPILMLTTESQDSKKAEGKAAGATGWLVKPFVPEKLLQVIAKVMP